MARAALALVQLSADLVERNSVAGTDCRNGRIRQDVEPDRDRLLLASLVELDLQVRGAVDLRNTDRRSLPLFRLRSNGKTPLRSPRRAKGPCSSLGQREQRW